MASDRWDPAAFKTRVDEVLHRFAAREADEFAAIDPLLGPVAEQLETAVADGKRLRAAFCYWGWRGGTAGQRRAGAGGGLDGARARLPRSCTTTSSTTTRCGTGGPRCTSPRVVPCGGVRAPTPPRGRRRCWCETC
jgi:hypothetical protein